MRFKRARVEDEGDPGESIFIFVGSEHQGGGSGLEAAAMEGCQFGLLVSIPESDGGGVELTPWSRVLWAELADAEG